MKKFNELPNEVKELVKDRLKVYDRTYVIFEYGEYHVSSGLMLKNSYGSDHEFIGEYTAKEIFTPDERIINYIETFHCYPIEYKGKRDYKMIKEMTWESKVRFDESKNIVLA